MTLTTYQDRLKLFAVNIKNLTLLKSLKVTDAEKEEVEEKIEINRGKIKALREMKKTTVKVINQLKERRLKMINV